MTISRRTALAAALAGFAGAAVPRLGSAQQQLATLNIATTPTDIGSEVFYAEERGFFKAAGIDAQVQVISNGAAITAAVSSGAVDVAQSNVVSLASAHQNGIDVAIIAAAGQYARKEPTSALVVAKDSPYRHAKDLNGKIIAGNGLKNITQVGAFAWLDKNGGDWTSVRFIELPFPNMAGALETGRIDAAVIAEPELSATLARGDRIIGDCYDAIAPNFLIGAWFTTGAWAKAHPDLVKRFQRAMSDAAAWANRNQAASGDLLTKYTQIIVEPGMRRSVYAEKLDPAQIQPLIDASAKYGALKASFPAGDLIAPEAR
jgi:NitT/TauT family transport system substrate-binding protein